MALIVLVKQRTHLLSFGKQKLIIDNNDFPMVTNGWLMNNVDHKHCYLIKNYLCQIFNTLSIPHKKTDNLPVDFCGTNFK